MEEVGQIRSTLDRVPSLADPVDRASALEEADSTLRSANGTKRSFKMEIRLVQDQEKRNKYTKKLKKLENELRTLKADLKALQAEEQRGELFVSGGAEGANGNGEMDPTAAGSNMLNEAAALQGKTQESLTKTKNMIAQSKEVGVSTLEELQRQREVIANIDKEADRMGDNLGRAEALVKQFGKRMAGDKFIQCFAVLNCLLFVGVVIYAIIKRRGGTLFGEPEAPTSPFGGRMLRGGYSEDYWKY